MKLSTKEDPRMRLRADMLYSALVLPRVLGNCTSEELSFMEQMEALYRDERNSGGKHARSGRRS